MHLKIKRIDTKGIKIISDGELGLVIICQQTTQKEHNEIKDLLENKFNKIVQVDIFYSWSNVSIFIFDIDAISDEDKRDIDQLIPKIKHAVILNGIQVKGSSVNELYVNYSHGDSIQIGKKFCTLLDYKKGE